MLLVTLTKPFVIVTDSALAAIGNVRIERNTMAKALIKLVLVDSIVRPPFESSGAKQDSGMMKVVIAPVFQNRR